MSNPMGDSRLGGAGSVAWVRQERTSVETLRLQKSGVIGCLDRVLLTRRY